MANVQPYYEDSSVTLYHGDCREVLHGQPQDVDLLLTDPPYGVGWQSNARKNALPLLEGDDGSLNVPLALDAALRWLLPHRHLYVFGRFDLTGLTIGTSVELIWDKQQIGGGDCSLPWGPSHEIITFAVKTGARSEKNGERLAARLRKGSVIRSMRRTGQGMNDRNALHPTEKPVDVLRQLIESSSILGETVLDPFAGSGSTLVAAKVEGRRAIGIEIDERYCETAARRLSQGVLPLEAA